MLRLAVDENFNGDILRGLLLRNPNLNVIRIQDQVIAGADDPDVPHWADINDRIMVTHDKKNVSPICIRAHG